jgi:hypothetical protein
MTHWTENDIEWLDEKVFSDMGNGLRREYMNELEADSAKKEAYQTVRLLQSASRLEHLQRKLTMLKEYDATLGSDVKKRWLYKVAAAASIILITGVALWFMTGNEKFNETALHNTFYADNPVNFQRDFVMHDTDHGADVLSNDIVKRDRAYDLFALQEFNAAIPYLEELWTEDKDGLALFYLIASHYFIGNEEVARELYERNALTLEQKQIDILETKLFK